VSTNRKKTWYGVRTLYRNTAEGQPKGHGRSYDPSSTLIEDRIVVFQAASFKDAISQAEKEARAYCKEISIVNPYGQRVRVRYLNACDAYELYDRRLAPGTDVFSTTQLISATVKDPAVVKRLMGRDSTARTAARLKFVDGGIMREALALMAKSNAPKERKQEVRNRIQGQK